LDFVHDQMTDGRRFRVLVIVEDCTRECLGAVAGHVPHSKLGWLTPRELRSVLTAERRT
jgi:putative transposase